MKFKEIFGLGAAVVAGAGAHAEGVNNNVKDKVVTDSTQEAKMKGPTDSLATTAQILKADEKFREIPVSKEVGGIKIEGMILIPMPSDTTREYYIVQSSGEGSNLIGKELAALESLGLKPASGKYLDEINPEAFRKAGQNVKAIDVTFEEGENLGQTRPMMVKENTVILVRNPIRTQSTEVKAMEELGTSLDYATIVYKDKKDNKTVNFQDMASNNK